MSEGMSNNAVGAVAIVCVALVLVALIFCVNADTVAVLVRAWVNRKRRDEDDH